MQQTEPGFVDEPTESFDGRLAVVTDSELDMLDSVSDQCPGQVTARRGQDDRIPATIPKCRDQGQQRVFSTVERLELAQHAHSTSRGRSWNSGSWVTHSQYLAAARATIPYASSDPRLC
jgi:hypothetical protein